MSDLICKKDFNPCRTPGMCAPHGGCQADKSEWQAGYDEGRRMGTKHMYAEVDRLKSENARSTEREIHQLAEIEVLRKIATELRRWASCEHVHHDKRDQHEFDEPCKVLERIDAAMSKGERS